jgi:transposase-like protein
MTPDNLFETTSPKKSGELVDHRLTEFAERYAATYPAPMKALLSDREVLIAYLRFPAEHHHQIWHSNRLQEAGGVPSWWTRVSNSAQAPRPL